MPTYTELMRGFEFGPWQVSPERGLLQDGDQQVHLEPLVMDVFVVLASHGGEVVTKDQLIDEVWEGRPQMDDVITRCISALRKGLGDDARNARYIETVQRRGYRVMLPVAGQEAEPQPVQTAVRPIGPDLWMIAVGFVAVILIAWFALIRAPTADVTGVTSIAIFPFDCLQDRNSSSGHLCFGFAEEAISSLKQVDGIQIVRKRKSYDSTLFIDEESVVTGSVQIVGEQVKVAAQLEDADSGVILWSETFDDGVNSIFSLQKAVASGLRVALDAGFTATAEPEAVSFAAAEAYARGRYLFEQRRHDSIFQAIGHFEEAIRLAPGFGPAWLGLAYTYSIWPDYDLTINREETFDKALAVMAEGVAADPSIRRAAGTVYGYVYLKRYEWGPALENTSMAVAADAPEGDDYHWHSRALASVGRLDEALHYARLAQALDPDYPALISRLAMASFWVNDLETAARYFADANEKEFGASIHALAYSLYLIRTGEFDEAKAWTRDALIKLDLDAEWVDPVFDGIAVPDDRENALALLDELQDAGWAPGNVIITLAVLLGETDRAMAAAREVVAARLPFDIEIIYIDEFRDFRQHPEFSRFAEEAGLGAYWRSAGCTWQDDRVSCPN